MLITQKQDTRILIIKSINYDVKKCRYTLGGNNEHFTIG